MLAKIVAGLGLFFAIGSLGCQSEIEATQGCAGLENAQNSYDVSVRTFNDTLGTLNTYSAAIVTEWVGICTSINKAVGIYSASQTDEDSACGALQNYIANEISAGTLTITVLPQYNCQPPLTTQADCEGVCTAAASCDPNTFCATGSLATSCNGSCDAECDIVDASATCTGTCEGTCNGFAATACSGICTGQCTGGWSGICTGGCSANFLGSCGGNCTGTCDGQASTGACAGQCAGACDSDANGACQGDCTDFHNGACEGACTGSCTSTAGVACDNTCTGTCVYSSGTQNCTGYCLGTCGNPGSNPSYCASRVQCTSAQSCQGSCEASAAANATCASLLGISVAGDDVLEKAIVANEAQILDAMTKIGALSAIKPTYANDTYTTLDSASSTTLEGISCLTSIYESGNIGNIQTNIDAAINAGLAINGQPPTAN